MKLVVHDFKSGDLRLASAPPPAVRPGGLLVRTSASLISAGTDRAVLELARKSSLAKALTRPDLARRVIDKVRTEGLASTYRKVQSLITAPLPLGYSLVGRVAAIGEGVHDVSLGGRVACAGQGHASHAESVFVPKNLFVPVPDEVDDEPAAYVTLGAIAMHGVRQADQQVGACVLVAGLGLVGQIAVQICAAAGYRVVAMDPDERKCDLAMASGAHTAAAPSHIAAAVARVSGGQGVDAALLTAASPDSGTLFDEVAELCRDRARIVVVGDVKMDMSRRAYFAKELEIVQSRSYGPGRYDADYEEKGRDYPLGYVRWTERRNMAAFLDLIADGRIDVSALTTHRYTIEEAEEAYRVVVAGDYAIGIVLTYADDVEPAPAPPAVAKAPVPGRIGLGLIGAGRFAQGTLLPAFMETGAFDFIGVASQSGLTAEALKDLAGARFATSDATAVLDDDSVQAVVVATRHDSHAEFVIGALERGKHVFVEKPLCQDQDELRAIEEAARASAGILCVGFNRRFSPLIDDMKAHFANVSEPLAMAYRVNAGRIGLDGKDAWVHEGGGRIVGEVCHFVDTLGALCGARPVSISAAAVNPGSAGLPATDTLTLTIAYDDGSLGTIHYWSNGDAGIPKERIEVYGAGRSAVLDDFRRLDLHAGGRTETKRRRGQAKGFAEEARAFAEACKSGEPPIGLDSLIDTTLVTFLAVEDLADSGTT
jgi:predicted dehydrogenase/threonine dehydrogenase-like Zn-dependent dehydrogenase